MSRTTAATRGYTGAMELFADRGPMNSQLRTDLAQAPTLGVQVGGTLNVHCATVTSLSRIVSGLGPGDQPAGGWLVICQSGKTTRRTHVHQA